MATIRNRYDFALLFDVRNGNPNGDPDAGNAPRIDPETGHGFVSDVCLKRKIRNYIWLKTSRDGKPKDGYDIYVKEGAILNEQHARAYKAKGLDPKSKKTGKIDELRAWMCQTFFDIRMFGAVMALDVNCGQVRGPVQIAFATSVDPIASLEQSITRMAVATVEEWRKYQEKQEGAARTMGRKEIVPYGLYVAHGHVTPHFAADTGFAEEDLELLWEALGNMFEVDRSAARGEMASRKLVVFEHESDLGNAPAHILFDRVKIVRPDATRPARQYSDYEVTVQRDNLPKGISLLELV
jgi:CRISPR-associated protein Csd2